MREVSDPNYQSKLLIYQSLEALVRVLPKDIATLQNSRNISPYIPTKQTRGGISATICDEHHTPQKISGRSTLFVNVDELLAPIGTGEILTGPFVKSSPSTITMFVANITTLGVEPNF